MAVVGVVAPNREVIVAERRITVSHSGSASRRAVREARAVVAVAALQAVEVVASVGYADSLVSCDLVGGTRGPHDKIVGLFPCVWAGAPACTCTVGPVHLEEESAIGSTETLHVAQLRVRVERVVGRRKSVVYNLCRVVAQAGERALLWDFFSVSGTGPADVKVHRL